MSTAQENSKTRFALGTFSAAGAEPFGGMLINDYVVPILSLGDMSMPNTVLGVLDQWEASLPRLQHAATHWQSSDGRLAGVAIPVAQLNVHAPYQPRQIFGVGANYRKHVIDLIMADPHVRFANDGVSLTEEERRCAAEKIMDERANNSQPYCFIKLPSSIAGPFDPLTLPADAKKIDWECELAVVIGRTARHVQAADAASYVAGYAIVNDVTARDLVFRSDFKTLGTDWLSAKSQPGFTPFGPYVVPAKFVDPYGLSIRLSVNDRLMQDELTSDMLIKIDRQIEYLSSRARLLPGDIICTGSPAGNGSFHGVFLSPGDTMVASISGLGAQQIACISPANALERSSYSQSAGSL